MKDRFLAALQFMSIIPVYGEFSEDQIGRSTPWFPVVGVCVGGLAGLVYFGCDWLMAPRLLSAVLAVATLAIVSGGLHLDGLADSADGLLSHRKPERMLEIMRDSRTGAMGVMVLIFSLLAKVAALSALPAVNGARALLVAAVAGRSFIAITSSLYPYARKEGLAQIFMSRRKNETAYVSLLAIIGVSWLAFGFRGIVLLAVTVVMMLWFNYWFKKKISGITGDTLGAVSELVEIITLIGVSWLITTTSCGWFSAI